MSCDFTIEEILSTKWYNSESVCTAKLGNGELCGKPVSVHKRGKENDGKEKIEETKILSTTTTHTAPVVHRRRPCLYYFPASGIDSCIYCKFSEDEHEIYPITTVKIHMPPIELYGKMTDVAPFEVKVSHIGELYKIVRERLKKRGENYNFVFTPIDPHEMKEDDIKGHQRYMAYFSIKDSDEYDTDMRNKGYIIDWKDSHEFLWKHEDDSTKIFPEVWVVKCDQRMDTDYSLCAIM